MSVIVIVGAISLALLAVDLALKLRTLARGR